MKNVSLMLLCCSAFLMACSDKDNASKSASVEIEAVAGKAKEVVQKTSTKKTEVAEANKMMESTVSAMSGSAITAGMEAVSKIKGEDIYNRSCGNCHNYGAAGAPKLGDKSDWESRIAQGETTMIQHAIGGFKAMPPKGGAMALSDAEVTAAVVYMVAQSK